MKKLEAIEKVQNSIKNVYGLINEICRNPKFDTISIKQSLSAIEKEYDAIASLEGKAKGLEKEIEACRLKFTEVAGWINQHEGVSYMGLDWSKVMPAFEKAAASVRPAEIEMER